MYAIIATGGKQYKVSEGDVIKVEKLDVEVGASVTFDQVIAVSDKELKVAADVEKAYQVNPIQFIDLKALMGDTSDNIPGVKGIGEKGAIKLLCEYGSLDGIYENIDKISGATKIKLIDGKDDAYYSRDLVTIYREVPLDVTFNDLIYKKENTYCYGD